MELWSPRSGGAAGAVDAPGGAVPRARDGVGARPRAADGGAVVGGRVPGVGSHHPGGRRRGSVRAAAVASGYPQRTQTGTRTRRDRPDRGDPVVIEREALIVNPLGVHARPAAEFVKTANRFSAAVEIRRGEMSVNGKSIMGVMMLAAEQGATIVISANGDDAEAAVEALCALVAAGFNEMDLTE